MKEVNKMTRFEQEITGALGEWWKSHAEKEVQRSVQEADELATVDENGAIKWNSNGHYLMDDFCERLEYAGYNFSRETTAKARDLQNNAFIAEYRRNYQEPTEEELFEMRAAFSEDATVVNILTGREIHL